MKILVMGLPGSGKTYLTERLVPLKTLILMGLLDMQLFPLNSYPFTKPYVARVCEGQNRVYK
jgi:hypothetical protein